MLREIDIATHLPEYLANALVIDGNSVMKLAEFFADNPIRVLVEENDIPIGIIFGDDGKPEVDVDAELPFTYVPAPDPVKSDEDELYEQLFPEKRDQTLDIKRIYEEMKQGNTIKALDEKYGIKYNTLYGRIKNYEIHLEG